MVDVETVFEGRVLLSGNLDEIFHKRVFWNCERLSNDDIVSFREKREGILNKVKTPSFEYFVNAEQVYHNGVCGIIRDFRELLHLKIFNQIGIFSVIKVTSY